MWSMTLELISYDDFMYAVFSGFNPIRIGNIHKNKYLLVDT